MRALHRALTDEGLRERLKERGYQQVAKFSWEASVRRMIAAYGEVCGKVPSATGQPAAD